MAKFKEHQGSSKCHRAAVTNEVIVSQCANVAEMMNEKERENMELNRRCLITILESQKYLARQGLALRGNDDETSNFCQLLKPRPKSVPQLEEWLGKKRGKYVTLGRQNEILKIMSNSVLREILDDVRDNMFSIMAGEYTDVSNKEQLTFCPRWVNDNLEVFEKSLGFYEIPNISSSAIVSILKDI